MTTHLRAALILALLVLGPGPGTTAVATAAPPSVAAGLQSFVESQVLAGAVTLVASREKVLALEAVGYADIAAKTPMRTDNLFWIASMTKPITAAALMMLVDEERVQLDDPVEKYLPEFRGQQVAVTLPDGGKELRAPRRPITIRNLLTHTSGLVNSAAAGQRWDMTSLKNAVECYAAIPLKFEPGTRYEYNNPGINTAGRIVEVVSGLPYEQFLARRLLEPLGMKETTFWPTAAQARRLAKAYKPNADKSGLEEMPGFAWSDPRTGAKTMAFPAGGLFSTAADVAQFCRMVLSGGTLDGKRYLSEKAVREMTRTQTGDLPAAYGLVWATDRKPGGPFGHAGAHKTEMRVFPQQGIITVLMVQSGEWRNDDGKKILPTFHQAAIKAFGQ